jgi:3'-5' exoribonuclease
MLNSVPRLPDISRLAEGESGWAFYLCTRKELRTTREGTVYVHVMLQDRSGSVAGRIVEAVERYTEAFDAGGFVRAEARVERRNHRLELVIGSIRRASAAQDAAEGFDEQDYVQAAPRAADEMWQELLALVARVENAHVRRLLEQLVSRHADRLRVWPAALTVHHAYRSGLLEHILKVAEVSLAIGAAYQADADQLIAGAILHDIGKLEELDYQRATSYTLEGNLLGHITIGVRMLHEAALGIEGFPRELLARLGHLIVSHHGSRDHGSPVEPMSIEAFILSAADDLDATLHQVRRHQSEAGGEGAFTAYHPRLGRAFLKPSAR